MNILTLKVWKQNRRLINDQKYLINSVRYPDPQICQYAPLTMLLSLVPGVGWWGGPPADHLDAGGRTRGRGLRQARSWYSGNLNILDLYSIVSNIYSELNLTQYNWHPVCFYSNISILEKSINVYKYELSDIFAKQISSI